MDDVMTRWRDHGFDIELGELGYTTSAPTSPAISTAAAGVSIREQLQELLAGAGLPRISEAGGATAFDDNYYCTSVKERQA